MIRPLSLEVAQERLLGRVMPLGSETVPVADAAGRYSSGPLLARRTQPAADCSAMDGFAMRADDLGGPWRTVGESAAGHPFTVPLKPGEAVRISTGALLPPAAGAILLQEQALHEVGTLRLAPDGAPSPHHIRLAGLDFCEGEPLLPAGALLTPARMALLLAGGHGAVEVGRRPALAVLESGDELAGNPQACPPHRVPASNGAMLAAMAAPLVSSLTRVGPVPDRLDALAAALEQAQSCDVLVTSGGASVGEHDLIRPALEAWGARIDFWRIAIRPGKPLLVARRGEQVILGLPGNPVSSFVTAFLFLLPLLRRLGGSSGPLPVGVALPLAAPLPPVGERMEFLRGLIEPEGVVPLEQQDSSTLASLGAADCLIQRLARSPSAKPGELVTVYWIHNDGMA